MTRAAAISAIAGASLAFLLLAALHLLRRDLDPSSHFISEYAVGEHGWVMALCFIALAVGCAGSVVVLHGPAGTVAGRTGLAFLSLAAIGLAMAAFFPMDPMTTAPENASFSGRMHGVAAMVGNPGFMIGATLLVFALGGNAGWAGARAPLIVATIAIWGAFALMMTAMPASAQDGPADFSGTGWPNRFLWAAYCAWIVAAAWPAATE